MPQGLVKNNPANDPDKKPVRSRSHFKPNVSVYQTARFGEVTPFYGAEVVPDDENFSIRVNSDVDTFTLKAPLMAPLRLNKDYFFAPLRAILPFNADRLVTNPLTGDDVIPEDVNCVIRPEIIKRAVNPICGNVASGAPSLLAQIKKIGNYRAGGFPINVQSSVKHLLGYFFLFYRKAWYWLSEGSVARNLGYNFHQMFIGPRQDANMERLTFDQWAEEYFSWIVKNIYSFQITLDVGTVDQAETSVGTAQESFIVYPGELPQNPNNNVISLRTLIYLLQQGGVPNSVSSLYLTDAGTVAGDNLLPFNPWADENIDAAVWNDFDVEVYQSRRMQTTVPMAEQKYFNLSRIIAYQLACIQFYTNDAVDYIYSPALWHENQRALIYVVAGGGYLLYSYNGVQVMYDCVSASPLARAVNNTYTQAFTDTEGSNVGVDGEDDWNRRSSYWASYLDFYFTNLLGFNRSLKFRDYFVGSKKSPMAVGNVNVPVTSGEFSVVDVTANILRQRFLNQVNRVGRTLKEYSQGIFGASPMRDPHEVVFLGSTTDIIGAEETQNTGDEQRTMKDGMTSRMRSESSKFAFEGSFQEFGVVVGVMSFDVARPYVNSCDRAIFDVTRFDMFNPFMQNIGDQAVFGNEIDFQQNETNFGYQLRYMQYRQRVDYCAGGFHHYLPGYAFLADYRNISNPGSYDVEISPDFIRSRSYELDDLYIALPYFSPAGYFHFIVRHDVDANISRPMLAAPSIL